MVREKEQKLRLGLNIYGVSHTIFWFSWFLVAIIFSAFIAVYLILTGYLFQFLFFLDTNFVVLFFLFFTFTFSMIMISFFITTLVSSITTSNTVTYAFLLTAIVIESFITSQGVLAYMYAVDRPSWVSGFIAFISLYPPFNYSKIYSDIALKSGYHYDMIQNMNVRGPGYKWHDFFLRAKGSLFNGGNFEMPSSFSTLMVMLADLAIYIIITWYFDHVVESNRGVASKPYFIFTFLCRKKRQFDFRNMRNSLGKTQDAGADQSNTSTVEKEKIDILERCIHNVPVPGIRIINLSKCYKSGCCSRKRKQALSGVYLEIEQGELLCLLGRNCLPPLPSSLVGGRAGLEGEGTAREGRNFINRFL